MTIKGPKYEEIRVQDTVGCAEIHNRLSERDNTERRLLCLLSPFLVEKKVSEVILPIILLLIFNVIIWPLIKRVSAGAD
jgi:hypothetical protein